ncbi:dnaJ-like protein 60 isoform X2 [Agrilus planipennis]|uniref:DnaJ-like protein 60 isoform X2 n=1 Tax=Agrilus planipennis TaxID=224129 RepID=A0A1W4W766_AGRPL|nr:dnaJ-like protein 60 isoform X2 [Agrilus planipennis]
MFFAIPFDKIFVNFRKCNPFICTRQFQRSNISFIRTHYDILNIKKGCTHEEIKNAFITLSKKYHPDVNKNANAHSEYTKILEAYNVLGKTESRRLYDLQLNPSVSVGGYNVHSDFADHNFTRYRPRKDPNFWENRDRTQDSFFKNKPYYGIEGIPKVSNGMQ